MEAGVRQGNISALKKPPIGGIQTGIDFAEEVSLLVENQLESGVQISTIKGEANPNQ